MNERKPSLPCPTCKKPIVWDEKNPWRPFCSERCKLIDLGKWASENYSIAAETEEDWLNPDEDNHLPH